MLAKIINTQGETFDGSPTPAFYVVPPIYGRIGEYFDTFESACAWAIAQGWDLQCRPCLSARHRAASDAFNHAASHGADVHELRALADTLAALETAMREV